MFALHCELYHKDGVHWGNFPRLRHDTPKPPRKHGITDPQRFQSVPIRTRFASGPLPAAIVIRTMVSTRMDDLSRIDHWRGRDNHWRRRDNRRGRDNRWLGNYRWLGSYSRCRRHDSGLGDHNGTGCYDVMRERNRRRRQADNARREAEPAAVVVVMPSREYARSGRHRKSHNNDFLRVHDLPRLSVSAEHHRPT